jgi:hypothetical protein
MLVAQGPGEPPAVRVEQGVPAVELQAGDVDGRRVLREVLDRQIGSLVLNPVSMSAITCVIAAMSCSWSVVVSSTSGGGLSWWTPWLAR